MHKDDEDDDDDSPPLVRRYHLKDVIVGKIYFLLVRIKIKYMELAIIKRETTGSGKGVSALTSLLALTA